MGLGLSIVKRIAALYRAQVAFALAAGERGLRVERRVSGDRMSSGNVNRSGLTEPGSKKSKKQALPLCLLVNYSRV